MKLIPIPIYLKTGELASQPPQGNHYVVARNGTFIVKEMSWVKATVQVERLPGLQEEQPSAQLLLPPLNPEILAQVAKFAWEIYRLHESEVCTLLHYQQQTGYALTVPEQIVSLAAVREYDAAQRLPGHTCVGTIHSHGRLPAFHSETDHFDEEDFDGVHVTLGDIHWYPEFSLSAEIVVNGNRFPVEQSWFEKLGPAQEMQKNELRLLHLDYPAITDWQIPEQWLKAVKKRHGRK